MSSYVTALVNTDRHMGQLRLTPLQWEWLYKVRDGKPRMMMPYSTPPFRRLAYLMLVTIQEVSPAEKKQGKTPMATITEAGLDFVRQVEAKAEEPPPVANDERESDTGQGSLF